jgi:N-methylhydantoinase A
MTTPPERTPAHTAGQMRCKRHLGTATRGERVSAAVAIGTAAAWAVYDRSAMPPGCRVMGPCIISEDETSTLVGPGWACAVDGLGYLELVREG